MSYGRTTLADAPTTGGDPLRDEAHLLYANGQQAFGEGRYDSALNAFQQAYRLIANPVVLIAIGQTFERLALQATAAGNRDVAAQRWSDALAQYRAYLQADPSGSYAITAHERIATLTAPIKEPSGAPMVPVPATVPSLTAPSAGPKVSGVVIAIGVGLLAIAGLAIWRSRAVRKNRRRVRRNRHSWTHDSDYAAALRDLDRSRAKLRQRL